MIKPTLFDIGLRITCGAMFAGMFLGFLEAFYQGAPIGYAMGLYGFLLGFLGLLTVTFLLPLTCYLFKTPFSSHRKWLLEHHRPGLKSFTLWCHLCGFFILRFLIFRDMFQEAPERFTLANLISASFIFLSASIAISHVWLSEKWHYSPCRGLHLSQQIAGILLLFIPTALIIGYSENLQEGLNNSTQQQLQALLQDNRLPKTIQPGTNTKNVFILTVDSLRADALGISQKQNNTISLTPHIDAWAEKAIWFSNASAQAASAQTSMASLLNSQYPSQHQVLFRNSKMPQNPHHLAALFQMADFQTVAISSNEDLSRKKHFHQGFDGFLELAPLNHFWVPSAARALLAYQLYHILYAQYITAPLSIYHQPASLVLQTAKTIIQKRQSSKPLWMWMHYMDTHEPYDSSSIDNPLLNQEKNTIDPGAKKQWKQSYFQQVQTMDAIFGEFLQFLKDQAMLDNSIILLTSDHGESFFEHEDLYNHNNLYEEILHIPLIVSLPETTLKIGERQQLVRHIDIAPSLLEACNLDIPSTYEGRSFLKEETPNDDTPQISLAEQYIQGYRLQAIRNKTSQSDTKWISQINHYPGYLPISLLFDLTTDPQEQQPLPNTDRRLTQMRSLKAAMEHHWQQEHLQIPQKSQNSNETPLAEEE